MTPGRFPRAGTPRVATALVLLFGAAAAWAAGGGFISDTQTISAGGNGAGEAGKSYPRMASASENFTAMAVVGGQAAKSTAPGDVPASASFKNRVGYVYQARNRQALLPPVVTAARCLDLNQDGAVDACDLTFSESVQDSSLVVSGFTLGGQAPTSVDTTQGGAFSPGVNDERLRLLFATPITGTEAKDLLYTASVGLLVDLSGNVLGDIAGGAVVEEDGAAPVLLTATASDESTAVEGVDGDDTVTLVFSEATSQPVIDASNIDAALALSGGHSWRDGSGNITGAAWQTSSTLVVTLSVSGGVPTVVVTDTVTPGAPLGDAASPANAVAGIARTLGGTFGGNARPVASQVAPAQVGVNTAAKVRIDYRLQDGEGSLCNFTTGTVEYRASPSGAWTPATISGSTSNLASSLGGTLHNAGFEPLFWDALTDVGAVQGQFEVRLSPHDGTDLATSPGASAPFTFDAAGPPTPLLATHFTASWVDQGLNSGAAQQMNFTVLTLPGDAASVQVLAQSGLGADSSPAITAAGAYLDTGLGDNQSVSYIVRATDALGNTTDSAAVSVVIADRTAPTAPAFSAGDVAWVDAGVNSASAQSVTVSVGAPPAGATQVQVRAVSGSGSDHSALFTAAGVYTDTGVADAQTVSYLLRALDAQGNYADSAAQGVTIGDRTPPATPAFTASNLLFVDAGLNSGDAQSARVTLATAPAGATTVRVLALSGQGADSSATIPVGSSPAVNYLDGGIFDSQSVSYRLRAEDAAGNFVESASASISIPDRTAPTTPPTISDGGQYSAVAGVTFAWQSSSDPGGSGVASYEVQVGTSAGASDLFSGNVGNVLLHSVNGADGQTLYARARALDLDGNASPFTSSTDGVTIDLTAPVVTVTFPNSGGAFAAESNMTITWSVVDQNRDSATLDFSTDGGVTFSPIAGPIPDTGSFLWERIPPRTGASVLVRARVTDKVGRAATDNADAPFTVGAPAPTALRLMPRDGQPAASGFFSDPAAGGVATRAAHTPAGPATFVDQSAVRLPASGTAGGRAAVADFDQDGDTDVFIPLAGSGGRLLINQGGAQGGQRGAFRLAAADQLPAATETFIAAVDLDADGDGDQDLFLVADNGQPRLFINQGRAQGGTRGKFADVTASQAPAGALAARCAAVADADRDGDADVVIGLAAGGVRLFRNQGSAQGGTRGAFAAAAEAFAPAASDVRAIAVGDVDGDGDLDLFCAVAGGPAELHVNQGGAQGGTTGLFQAAVAPALPAAAAPDARDVLLADVDGDGDLDAFLTGPAGETLLLNQGGAQGGERGRFVGAAAGALPASAGAGGRLAAGDMDGDGDLDIVVARGDAKTDTLLLNQGALQDGSRGVFAPATVAAFPADAATTLGVLLLDGDGDGDLDIFIRQADRERYFDNSRR